MSSEKVRLRIGSLANAVLITGQAYQDPKDAINEFVSNAADEYLMAGRPGGRISVVLRRKGRYPMVAIDDEGRGMGSERLREVAQNLFKSIKVGDDRTLGEKAIGLLAFQQLAGRCDIVSRAEGSSETWALRLARGKATAELVRERRRARTTPGTTVYLTDLEPEVLRMLTQRKVVDYLRRRRGPALERGDYSIEVQEGRTVEVVTPERPDGMRVPINPMPTLWGTIEFSLYVASGDGERRQVAVVGRAGTTIVDSITELEEFDTRPWNSGQVAGSVAFAGLQQTAGRRAVLRERDTFPAFVEAVRAVEPVVSRTVDKVNAEVDRTTADRLSDTIRRVFGAVLRELDDIDNPMRSATGQAEGSGGLLVGPESGSAEGGGEGEGGDTVGPRPLTPPEPSIPEPVGAAPERPRRSRLPSVAPDPNLADRRSRFDEESGTVLYSTQHADYLMVKDSEPALLDYLATLVAKEYVVYNNPRSGPEDFSEELVRMLVRVRRHLPRRR